MTTTQEETPISITSIFPTFTVLEARPLKANPSVSCSSKYRSRKAAQTVNHLQHHLAGQMQFENSVLLKNPTRSDQTAGSNQQLSLDLLPRNHQFGYYSTIELVTVKPKLD